MNVNKKLLQRLLIICVVIALILFIKYSGFGSHFTLENIKLKSASLKTEVEKNYIVSVLFFIIGFILLIISTIPVLAPMAMLGGYLFGIFPGFIYSIIAATIGATASFLGMRYIFAALIEKKYQSKLAPSIEKVKEEGASYLLMMQFLTIFPYFIINMLAAIAHIPLQTFLWTTIIGGAPVIFIYVMAGQQLGTINQAKDILSPTMIMVLILLACLAFIPVVVKKLKK